MRFLPILFLAIASAIPSQSPISLLDIPLFLAKDIIESWSESQINNLHSTSKQARIWIQEVLSCNTFTPQFHSSIFKKAVVNNHTSLFKTWMTLTSKNGFKLSHLNNSLLHIAIRNRNDQMIRLFLNDARVSLIGDNGFVFGWAAESGHFDLVQYMLKTFKSINPSAGEV